MKKLLSLLTAFALVLTLAGCGDKKETTPEQPTAGIDSYTAEQLNGVEIEFWHAQSKANGEIMQKLVDKFNAENEWGIKVKATYQGGYDDIEKKITAALVSGTQPSVAQGYGNHIINFMKSGQVICLNDYIESEKWGMTDEEFEDILPAYRTEMAAFPDGKIYQVPSGKSSEVIYYNTTMFEENGWEVPTTWAEVETVAREASKVLGKPAFGVDSTSNFLITNVQNWGGAYTNNDGETLFINDENIEKTLDFLEWFSNGVNEGIFRLAGEDKYMNNAFTNGDIAFYVGSNSGVKYLGKMENWDAAPYPAGPANNKVMQQGANLFAMKTDDPIKDLAAYLFLEFMISTESSATYALNTGYLPVRQSSRELPEFKEFMENGGNKANAKQVTLEYDKDRFTFDPIFIGSNETRTAAGKIINSIGTDAVKQKLTREDLLARVNEFTAKIK